MYDQTKMLLKKYVEGCLSASDQEHLAWLLGSKEGQKALTEVIDEEAKRMLLADLRLEGTVSERMWKAVEERMDGERPKRDTRRVWAGWAASLLVLMSVAGAFWWNSNVSDVVTYTTAATQKRSVILPDGSLVTLNANSSISYQEGRKQRKLALAGEAYFDIKQEQHRPFLVTAGDVQVKVLGTSFNVKAYDGQEKVTTTLLKGKVLLTTNTPKEVSGITLQPNQVVSFVKAGKKFVEGDMQEYFAQEWRNGNLVFENEPLKHILPELEKWYGVSFEIEEALSDCRFSMAIDDESLDELLHFFELTAGANMKRLPGGGIHLDARICD